MCVVTHLKSCKLLQNILNGYDYIFGTTQLLTLQSTWIWKKPMIVSALIIMSMIPSGNALLPSVAVQQWGVGLMCSWLHPAAPHVSYIMWCHTRLRDMVCYTCSDEPVRFFCLQVIEHHIRERWGASWMTTMFGGIMYRLCIICSYSLWCCNHCVSCIHYTRTDILVLMRTLVWSWENCWCHGCKRWGGDV